MSVQTSMPSPAPDEQERAAAAAAAAAAALVGEAAAKGASGTRASSNTIATGQEAWGGWFGTTADRFTVAPAGTSTDELLDVGREGHGHLHAGAGPPAPPPNKRLAGNARRAFSPRHDEDRSAIAPSGAPADGTLSRIRAAISDILASPKALLSPRGLVAAGKQAIHQLPAGAQRQ